MKNILPCYYVYLSYNIHNQQTWYKSHYNNGFNQFFPGTSAEVNQRQP